MKEQHPSLSCITISFKTLKFIAEYRSRAGGRHGACRIDEEGNVFIWTGESEKSGCTGQSI